MHQGIGNKFPFMPCAAIKTILGVFGTAVSCSFIFFQFHQVKVNFSHA